MAGSERSSLHSMCSNVQRGIGSTAGTKKKLAGGAVVAEIPTLAYRLSFFDNPTMNDCVWSVL